MEPKPIRMARPCTDGAQFEMRPEGRFCLSCQKTTYDLRDSTRSEVVALMRASGGTVCARVRAWPSGEVRFRPEPPRPRLSVLGGAMIAAALAGCDAPAPEPSVVPEPTATPEIAEPPSTTVGAPTAPPSTVAVPDDIDHSTDASRNVEDHRHHQHRHAPVENVHDVQDDILGGLDGL